MCKYEGEQAKWCKIKSGICAVDMDKVKNN